MFEMIMAVVCSRGWYLSTELMSSMQMTQNLCMTSLKKVLRIDMWRQQVSSRLYGTVLRHGYQLG